MNPMISVVIPNYNGGRYVVEAVESALAQDYKPCEVIVVDDGSVDNSLDVLKHFGSRIELIYGENAGAAHARNIGILASKGEFVAFLDSDDKWSPNKLSVQFAQLISQRLDLVCCHAQEFGELGSGGAIHKAQFSGNCYGYFLKFPTRAIIKMGSSTALIRKSILVDSGLFDEDFKGAAEDWDFFRRYCKFAKVGFSDQVLSFYRRHRESVTARSVEEYYQGNEKAVIKMFLEDSNIHFIERRVIWVKFQFISAKSFIKKGEFSSTVRSLMHIFQRIVF